MGIILMHIMQGVTLASGHSGTRVHSRLDRYRRGFLRTEQRNGQPLHWLAASSGGVVVIHLRKGPGHLPDALLALLAGTLGLVHKRPFEILRDVAVHHRHLPPD